MPLGIRSDGPLPKPEPHGGPASSSAHVGLHANQARDQPLSQGANAHCCPTSARTWAPAVAPAQLRPRGLQHWTGTPGPQAGGVWGGPGGATDGQDGGLCGKPVPTSLRPSSLLLPLHRTPLPMGSPRSRLVHRALRALAPHVCAFLASLAVFPFSSTEMAPAVQGHVTYVTYTAPQLRFC